MFSSTTLSLLLVVISSVHASPIKRSANPVTLKFAHTISSTLQGASTNVADFDRARAAAMLQSPTSNSTNGTTSAHVKSADITNSAMIYTAQIGIGSPATTYNMLIDTGSSNTWIHGSKYKHTATTHDTGHYVGLNYGSGYFDGNEYTDTVSVVDGLAIHNQSIGIASKSSGFDFVDGILGLGPVDLTKNSAGGTAYVPTVTDNLYSSGQISSNELGIFFRPIESGKGEGELTWGGYDSSKVVGSVNYVAITKTSPASTFWGVDSSIKYGNTTIQHTTAGIVDTGTTLLLLAANKFAIYQREVGADKDKTTGLLKITKAQYAKLKNLDIKIGTHTYSMTPNAQIWPRALNSKIKGTSDGIYLIVASTGAPAGQGNDFIYGYSFLERFYTVYDTANHRVGFATTSYTHSTTN